MNLFNKARVKRAALTSLVFATIYSAVTMVMTKSTFGAFFKMDAMLFAIFFIVLNILYAIIDAIMNKNNGK